MGDAQHVKYVRRTLGLLLLINILPQLSLTMTPDAELPRLAALSCGEVYIGCSTTPPCLYSSPMAASGFQLCRRLHRPRGACRRRRCNWARACVKPLRSCSTLGRQRVDVVRADPA
ncbi:hypothetical protein B0H14DRAFT_2967289 [Mycena olivaceomarginata]|nr:hypothetical protein B0H14DRAFT_3015775 [Mycena olivaceomarginata]KAJ7769771.1 hypothetical protein B0H14DRAFT_2967289 [Mycena olivaceomarginata]